MPNNVTTDLESPERAYFNSAKPEFLGVPQPPSGRHDLGNLRELEAKVPEIPGIQTVELPVLRFQSDGE